MQITGLSEAGDGSEDEGHFLLRVTSSLVFVTLSLVVLADLKKLLIIQGSIMCYALICT